MKGSGGYRRKTRDFQVGRKRKGKVFIREYLQKFEKDALVAININPRYQQIPHPRFQGKTGRVVGSQGRAYYVKIKDGRGVKKILVSPQHLTKIVG